MLPAHKFHGMTIVVSPLKSLIDDQLKVCMTHNIGASALHGDLSESERQGIYMCLKQQVYSYVKLSELRKSFPNVSLLMLTATASKVTRDDIISMLGARNTQLVLSPMDRENIFYEVRQKN
ncbi:unnamed protein product, partial [Porites lobata]